MLLAFFSILVSNVKAQPADVEAQPADVEAIAAAGVDSPIVSPDKDSKKPTNILMILVDDLGWSDTSVAPFTGNGIKTPYLEAMASRGMILDNFHAAATICSPTRASILTGMNPWRSGISGVFEYGMKSVSNRDDWLLHVPTVADAFRAANYTTLHSGKWHMGGMRNDDFDLRTMSPKEMNQGMSEGSKRCPHPGPNQQGFDEYVSYLDGPGSPRQNELQLQSTLHSQGCAHMIHNDLKLDRFAGFKNGQNPDGTKLKMTLSDCEAGHAV